MTGRLVCWWATCVLAAVLLIPAAVKAEPPCDCPGSGYSPCHYNFPLVSRFCARFHWHAAPEESPPFSQSFYEYRSHCPYAAPAALLGFPSLTQRSKLASSGNAGQ